MTGDSKRGITIKADPPLFEHQRPIKEAVLATEGKRVVLVESLGGINKSVLASLQTMLLKEAMVAHTLTPTGVFIDKLREPLLPKKGSFAEQRLHDKQRKMKFKSRR